MESFRRHDTIAAQATPPGEGGIAIVRVSGPACREVLSRVFAARNGQPLLPRRLTFGHILDGEEVVDEAMAVLMPAPHSYTREDVGELHCHGSQALVARVLALLLRAGARMAAPGEFTYRAFIGGRVDLSQAEAVMRMIRAGSERAMRSAHRQMEGGVSAFVHEAREAITALLAALSAAVDFPDEVEESLTSEEVSRGCAAIAARLRASCDPRAGRIEDEGLRVALAGRPNAGKSTLLNALVGGERAIVTDVPGTTRDTLTERICVNGVSIVLTDTAGLRETDDPVERLGVERARRAAAQADVVLAVLDGSTCPTEDDLALLAQLKGLNAALILNKADLPARLSPEEAAMLLPGAKVLSLSARDPATLQPLRTFLAEQAAVSDHMTLTQPRHLEAARRAALHLRQAAEADLLDLAAIDLQSAQAALGEITGDQVEERLLDRVFSQFCVGK